MIKYFYRNIIHIKDIIGYKKGNYEMKNLFKNLRHAECQIVPCISASHSVIINGAKNLKNNKVQLIAPYKTTCVAHDKNLSTYCLNVLKTDRNLPQPSLTKGGSKKAAFTLAEVLITLGIIGVVAALTIPSLIQKHQKIVLVNQLKKVYTEMSQAAKQIMVDEGTDDLTQTSLAIDGLTNENIKNSAGNFLKKYFKIAKDCGLERGECFASDYKLLNGSTYDINNGNYYYFVVLSNGASIAMLPAQPYYEGASASHGFIDVNGPKKGPNTFGRDIYHYSLYYDGSIAEISPMCRKNNDCPSGSIRKTDEYWKNGENGCNNGGYGGCLDKIIRDGWVMDY